MHELCQGNIRSKPDTQQIIRIKRTEQAKHNTSQTADNNNNNNNNNDRLTAFDPGQPG